MRGGSKKKERKEEQRPLLSLFCLPTNTLSPSVPPAFPRLSPPQELRVTQSSPLAAVLIHLLILFGTNDCDCGLLFQKSATPAQSISSDCHCKWARRYCRPQIQLQKRGARRPPLRAGHKTDCRETCADSDLRRLEAGHRPFTALPVASGRALDLYLLFFTVSFLSLVSVIGSGQSIL